MESAAQSLQARQQARVQVRRVRLGRRTAAALSAWLALIALGTIWGHELLDSGAAIGLSAPPFFGAYGIDIHPSIAISFTTAALLVALAPRAARSVRWPWLLVLATLAAFAWPLAVMLASGPAPIGEPLEHRGEYLTAVPLVDTPGQFLQTFTERIAGYPTHVRGHPPGMVMALWGLDGIGLGGSTAAALLVLAVAASAVPAVLIGARAVMGERAVRRAAPFLVLAPAAVWIATSVDGLLMGVGAWAITVTSLAIIARGFRSDLLAVFGGLLFAACLLLSYGLVLLGAIPLALAAAQRRARPLLVASAAVLGTMVAVGLAGFNWIDGFFATREQYLAGISQARPYEYFVVNNLAVFAVAAGPATAVALARPRERRAWILVGGGLAMVLAADLSGMSKAEVERIWLPFLPWVMLATAVLPLEGKTVRLLLAAQALLAIALQVILRTIW